MIAPAIYLLGSPRNVLNNSLILAAGIGFIIFALFGEPRIRNQPPLQSKWAIALWRVGFTVVGLAAICGSLYLFSQ
jgi:hypothetical protein